MFTCCVRSTILRESISAGHEIYDSASEHNWRTSAHTAAYRPWETA